MDSWGIDHGTWSILVHAFPDGLASAGSTATEVLVDGYAYGSLSMASYVLDATPQRPQPPGDPDSPALPDIDPAQTNL